MIGSTPAPFFAEILAMRNQSGWRQKLGDFVMHWEFRFLNPREKGVFPRRSEFEEFESLLREAGRHCNIAEILPGHWWRAIKRINFRCPKFGLVACLDKFFKNLKEIHREPRFMADRAFDAEK